MSRSGRRKPPSPLAAEAQGRGARRHVHYLCRSIFDFFFGGSFAEWPEVGRGTVLHGPAWPREGRLPTAPVPMVLPSPGSWQSWGLSPTPTHTSTHRVSRDWNQFLCCTHHPPAARAAAGEEQKPERALVLLRDRLRAGQHTATPSPQRGGSEFNNFSLLYYTPQKHTRHLKQFLSAVG